MIVFPLNELKWTFKEGDVAVLSSPRPGSGSAQVLEYGIVSFTLLVQLFLAYIYIFNT